MNKKVLVLGIGDIVLHDNASGLYAVRQLLSSVEWPNDVDVVQRLSDQCQLQPDWMNYESMVIVVAVADNKAPGTVHVTRARCSDCIPSSGVASPSLERLVSTMAQAAVGPEVYIVIISMQVTSTSDFELPQTLCTFMPQLQMLLRGLVGMLTCQQECVYY